MEDEIYYLLIVLQIELLIVALIVLLPKMLTKTARLKRPSFVDTSVLIDGRILHAARAGFIPEQLVIPKSVLAELQLLADGADSDKRSRARHGLDVAQDLQDMHSTQVTILQDGTAEQGVDERLISLAKKYKGSLCTIDFNLNKVATVEGVTVLNINELAKELRMDYLPGERIMLTIAQKGNDAQQGVGYLADGTMVVVDKAQSDINHEIEIEFIRSIQTAAGRMLFAKKVHATKSVTRKTEKIPAKQSVQQRSERPAQRSRKKPASVEDSMVELANK
jgi:uncharacterized protein YacL